MSPPLIAWVAVVMEGLPFPLGLLLARRQTEARRWFMLQAAVCTIFTFVGGYLGRHQLYNVFLNYYYIPVEGALLLWMLSHWQASAAGQRRIRLAIPVMIVSWIAVSLLVEDPNNYTAIGDNLYNLLMIALMVSTLVHRSAAETGSLLERDWFWICGGFAMHFGVFTAFNAVAWKLAGTDWTLLMRVQIARSWLDTVAMGIACLGLFCRPPRPMAGPAGPCQG